MNEDEPLSSELPLKKSLSARKKLNLKLSMLPLNQIMEKEDEAESCFSGMPQSKIPKESSQKANSELSKATPTPKSQLAGKGFNDFPSSKNLQLPEKANQRKSSRNFKTTVEPNRDKKAEFLEPPDQEVSEIPTERERKSSKKDFLEIPGTRSPRNSILSKKSKRSNEGPVGRRREALTNAIDLRELSEANTERDFLKTSNLNGSPKDKRHSSQSYIQQDIQIIKKKLTNHYGRMHRDLKINASYNKHYTMCLCCIRFSQYRYSYMFILVNDIILSANLTLYTFISTFSFYYYCVPLFFFLISTITYVLWRVQSERFTRLNKYYLWFRCLILLLVNIPFLSLVVRLLKHLSSRKSTEEIPENLSENERLVLSMVSLNNVYVLIGFCFLAFLYNLFSLVWNCQMKRILDDAAEFQNLKAELMKEQEKLKNEEEIKLKTRITEKLEIDQSNLGSELNEHQFNSNARSSMQADSAIKNSFLDSFSKP